jgi:hypothetical protein
MANQRDTVCHRYASRLAVPDIKRNKLTLLYIFDSRSRRLRISWLLGLLLSCASAAIAQKNTVPTPPKNVLTPPPLSAPPAVPTAVQSVSPFTIIGFLQSATLNTSADASSGGTMVVNGYTISVSASTLVNMPGTLLRFSELFSLAPRPWGPTQTGLTVTDRPKPLATYEVLVQGNRVTSAGKDQYLAGLIFVSQQSLNSGQGFINYIDYTTGELRVGGLPNDPSTGARVRLNDPIGRFGRAMSPDVRFTIDENNPTVRSASGYPMCIPRVNLAAATQSNPVADDPLCPQVNRPKDPTTGGFLSFISMPPPLCTYFSLLPSGAPAVAPPNCTLGPAVGAPDATRQMPFEVGDYVTFRGNIVPDTTSPGCVSGTGAAPSSDPACQYLSAWSVIANLGAYTSPGVMPAYVAIDVTLMGTGGSPIRGVPLEATSIVRVEGFTTDPTEPVDIYGVDVDPCTGATTDRYWGTQPIDQIFNVFGRFRFRPLGGTFLPPVREVRVVTQTLTQGVIPAGIASANTFANGLSAGQYDAPMNVFIFPEGGEIGTRIALNFEDFPFLADNVGTIGPGRCTASLTPSALSFADQVLGKTSAPQTVTLTNTGTGGLNISKMSISPNFSQTNDCGTHLAFGASCSLSVTYLPNSPDPQDGVLQVSDTASGSPQLVNLLGTVATNASVTPTALSFPDQALGIASAPQTVTLKNTGAGALNISKVSLSAPYSQTNDCGTRLEPGASCTFSLVFQPASPGAIPGSFQVSDNATGSSQTVSLIGTGIMVPIASWSATALSFSDQAPWTMSAPQAVTLTNKGSAGLNIKGVYLDLGYAQANDCPPVLQPAAKCTFALRFLPRAVGAKTGNLRITNNAAGSPHSVSLTGISSDFTLSPDPGSAMSVTVAPGSTATYRLRITGTSMASGTVNLSYSGLPPGAICAFSPATVTLNGAQSQSVTVLISASSGPLTAQGSNKRSRSFPLAVSLLSGVVAAVFTRWRPRTLLLVIIAFCALTLNGCGGGGEWTDKGAPQVTITATGANGAVHSVRLRLTIQRNPAPSRPKPLPVS